MTGPPGFELNREPLNEPPKTFRLLLKEAKTKIDKPIEIVLIGGAAALLTDAVKRVIADIDIVDSGLSPECGLL